MLLIFSVPLGSRLHQATLGWQYQDIIFSQDSIYGRLVILGRATQRIFFENGLMMFETQGTFPEEVVHFPMLEHPDPRSVLLIGGGAGGDLREILKYPVEEVHYVELDPLLIQAAREHLPPDEAAVLDDPRVTLAHIDGRLYVKQSKRSFDVIIVDLPEPYTGQLNRFYTEEFFREVQAILNPGGILSLGVPSAENYWSPELARRNANVFHTLKAVFPSVMALPGDYNFFLASSAPLSEDHTLLTQRLHERGIENRWVNDPYIEYIFTTDRFALMRLNLERFPQIKINRDLVPICYYYDMVLWISLFYAGLRDAFNTASVLSLWWLVIPLAGLVLLLRWRRYYAIPSLIGFTGLAEMTIEMVVLLAFQALHGYVYHQLSLIVAAFMVGAAVGGATMNQIIGRLRLNAGEANLPKVPDYPSLLTTKTLPFRILFLAQVVVVVYALAMPFLLTRATAWMFPLLTLFAGFLGGFDFPLAAELTRRDDSTETVGRVAGLIYGMDLVGACLGALLASALFIPVLGIPQTCYAVALLSLAGLALLL